MPEQSEQQSQQSQQSRQLQQLQQLQQQQQPHAKFSPSKLPRILLCPASALYEQSIDQASSSSIYADEGTLLHLVMAELLDKSIFLVPQGIINKYKLTATQQQMAQDCLDYAFSITNSSTEDYTYYIETYVTLDKFADAFDCEELTEVSGTLDFSLVRGRELYIVDWKFGAGVEVQPESAQLRAYALGKIGSPANLRKFDFVHLTIVQPRAPSKEYVKTFVCTPDDLYKWLNDEVVPALSQTRAKHPVYHPSIQACRWCPIKATCTARLRAANKIAAQVFVTHDAMEQAASGEAPIFDLVQLYSQAKELTQYLQDIEEYIVSQLKHGQHVPGYKLVPGRSQRAWQNEQQAKDWCIAKGLNGLLLHEIKFKSPAKIEKILPRELRQDPEFQSLIHKPEGRPTLVKESDPRQALQFKTAIEVFAEVL